MLNDDCLGRTLDWLYAHDLTKLFAGIASRARQVFGISAHQVHVDTTSFSVSGAYSSAGEQAQEPGTSAEALEAETALIAITYGYSRDHREDLKQWMLALATTHEGDVPLFLQPLDGNSSDKVSLLAAVLAIQKQLREADGGPSVYVADNGIYSEQNRRQLNAAGVKWVSRVSETSTEASGFAGRWTCRRAANVGSTCAQRLPSSAPRLRCNGRSVVLRRVGSGSAGIWARGALPVKRMHGQPWSRN